MDMHSDFNHRFWVLGTVGVCLFAVLLFSLSALASTDEERWENVPGKELLRNVTVANPNTQNRTHRKTNVWLTITNWGYFGNNSPGRSDALEDPEYPGTWAPQCEYPGGSDVQYLFMGALWIGALVQEEGFEFPRVSVGSEGWTSPLIHEFFPGEGAEHGIVERSTRPNEYNRLGDFVSHPDAVSEQDFICDYSDTLTDPTWVRNDDVDGPHFPMGIKVYHRSYSWTYNYAQDFIIIDYEIENIAGNYLKNLYVGLYVDSDVGRIDERPDWHQDDICGFQEWFIDTLESGGIDSVRINTAYIADNDGRPYALTSGSNFSTPGVSGTRVVRAPNPRLYTTFNWWISNRNPDLDFGPSWENDASGGWTQVFGTPMGDERKYFVMSNKEFDYDQVYVDDPAYIAANPQHLQYIHPVWGPVDTVRAWKQPDAQNAQDLADGYDTRYLISWGPLGIYDHTDEQGNDIFRLNPGEKFHMTMAYVCGDNFHQVGNPQVSNTNIDPSKFSFADLTYNASWAAKVYDNHMIDTPCFDYGNDGDPNTIDEDGSQGDGIYDTGDGWYGEDRGSDNLFALLPPGVDSIEVFYFGLYQGVYYGPDPDGSEQNGQLDPGEDQWPLPENQYIDEDGLFTDPLNKFGTLDLKFMQDNYRLDAGDGIPDFQGPPPPEPPEIEIELSETEVILHWSKYPSEDPTKIDPFSRVQDFEGYRIYVGNTGLENDFSLIAEFDRVDFAYYNLRDSLATYPDTRTNAPSDTVINGVLLQRKPVRDNVGLEFITDTDTTYIYRFRDVHPLFPRWYSVTAIDFGDPKSGTEPLETARTANAKYVAPSGNPRKEVIVVPNPYRAYVDYTRTYSGGLRWENQDDGTPDFFPSTDRRLEFINLPRQCLIRIFTLAGDLVAIVPHNIAGDDNIGWASDFSESWDLNSRNNQQVVSGLYLFSVEDYTEGNKGDMQTGKFVIIR